MLQEFYVQATRKWPESRDEARAEVKDLLAWHPVTVDAAILERGWKLQDHYQLSFWDALILHAAEDAGVSILYSEDLATGQRYGAIQVVNPLIDPEAA